VDKREGGGSHNWGTYEDEIRAAEDDKVNVSADGSAIDATAVSEDAQKSGAADDSGVDGGNKDDSTASAAKASEEDEPKTLTLDEWKAQQSRKEEPKFNLRKAGEGQDLDPKWKKGMKYQKFKETNQEEDEDEVGDDSKERTNWAFGDDKDRDK